MIHSAVGPLTTPLNQVYGIDLLKPQHDLVVHALPAAV